jgi:hypothetical protein
MQGQLVPLQLGASSFHVIARADKIADAAQEWPADIPGLWKGAVASGTGNGSSVYWAVAEGYTPNFWIFLTGGGCTS